MLNLKRTEICRKPKKENNRFLRYLKTRSMGLEQISQRTWISYSIKWKKKIKKFHNTSGTIYKEETLCHKALLFIRKVYAFYHGRMWLLDSINNYFWQRNQLQGSWLNSFEIITASLRLCRNICISSTMTQEDDLLQMTHLKCFPNCVIHKNSFQSPCLSCSVLELIFRYLTWKYHKYRYL